MRVLHITDLFNPPGDPDDHFDLLTLLSIPDLEVAGGVIDHTVARGVPGTATIAKAAALCGRGPIPCAVGLTRPLDSESDTGIGQPKEAQAAVELILACLERCPDRGMIFTIVGSMRDLAAAYNREPALFHAKVARLMVNAGDSCGEVGPQDWNTALDLAGWRRIMASGLPVDWFPCNPSKGRGRLNHHVSYWSFPQKEILGDCPARVKEFFDSEQISTADPVTRHMWSTVSFLETAKLAGCATPEIHAVKSYEMTPASIELGGDGTAHWSLRAKGSPANARILTIADTAAYGADMNRFLRACFAKIGAR
jgi:hypothetical protein